MSDLILSDEKVALIKRTICKDATDDELEMFLMFCKKTGLDPFLRQIYFVKRMGVGTIQVAIDGYRLVAERTGRYAPGRATTFTYDEDKKLLFATAYVKKMTADGTWHEISASALFSEYCQMKSGGQLTVFWSTKPHIMLAKCAESQALRRAFPAELGGMYTTEEMVESHIEADMDIEKLPHGVPDTKLSNVIVDSVEALDGLKMTLFELMGDDCPSLDRLDGYVSALSSRTSLSKDTVCNSIKSQLGDPKMIDKFRSLYAKWCDAEQAS